MISDTSFGVQPHRSGTNETPAQRENPRLQGMRCIHCGARYPVQEMPAGCPACAAQGTPASVEAVYSDLPRTLAASSSGYTWGEWLPYTHGVSLGEGNTPCLTLPRLARSLGIRELTAKHEGVNPTGSHKDRMSAQAVTRALAVGASKVVLASSGNAAVSAAAYCAAAGLPCEIATYRDMPESFARALDRLGARRVAFDQGLDRWTHVRRQVLDEGAFALTNFSVPAVGSPAFGVEGYRAVALECVAEGCVPDHVLVPTARGDLLWGLYSGLRDLLAAGLITHMPRLWAVEPFARLSQVLAGAPAQADFSGSTAQFSIAGSTVTLQQQIAVQRSGGGAAVVGDADAARGVAELGAQGLWVELCAGACVGAASQLRRQGRIAPEDHVLLLLTAKGDRDA
ncbi:pyridoxal-phosphate dependent enzyme [Acidovorax sp. A1169]|uniref:pyridoxal-phosphate dependent enzyme n=1 Tax=Acidovorax sp. A1169 TaxID=3059524 RepID=UPI002737A590|nr:pyridoxal-phosphate dependent enzyme [Acidovorax sp. A1169]MDP4076073.1 pyridoxal-phosphate dependent enzyme [Acidovorax sp. A1169]